MDQASASNFWRCECNYKCKHSSQGWSMVSRRTYFNHQHQDSLGNIHPIVSKRQRVGVDCPLQDLEDGGLQQIEPSNGLHQEVQTTTREDASGINSQNEEKYVLCTCNLYCEGGRRVHLSTFYRHQNLMNNFESLRKSFGLSDPNVILNVETITEHCFEDDLTTSEMSASLLSEDIIGSGTNDLPTNGDQNASERVDSDKEANGVFFVQSELIERIMELQGLWDEHKISVKVQDMMLRILFGDFGGSRVNVDSSRRSIARLLLQLPSSWEGDLGGVQVPACWSHLQSMLKGLGMVTAHRHRICTGFEGVIHTPQLFYPSNEDNYVGDIPKCTCEHGASSQKLKRDCTSCGEKCTLCNNARKAMLAFDYIPIGPQLKLIMKSKTFCHELLSLWRNRTKWLGQNARSSCESIIDFWDGSKFQEVKDFWNPQACYELPVVCTNGACKKSYSTFPASKRSRELERSWNGEEEKYNFVCLECKEDIQCSRQMCKGDPRNVALLLHWDGFQTSRTTQKSCGVVEIMLLNAGKYTTIDVLPVLFLPWSCKKVVKKSGDVFGTFLRPLVDELEALYLNGIDVVFEYPIECIFGPFSTESKACNLRAMVMMVTGDHPAQCKIGLLKNGGQEFCRRDKAQATQCTDNPRSEGRYVYDGNRQQARYKAPKRTVEEMTLALYEAKRVCSQSEREDAWKSAGLSGESILWRLYDLYGFDLSLDLVFDAMHTLSLNMFKKYIARLFQNSSPSSKKKIDEIVAKMTKVVPASIRHGRWPNSPSMYHDSFKAEENQKFIQWCLPYILRVVDEIPPQLEGHGLLLIDIAHSFYNFSRDHGWSMENIEIVKTLLLSWRVRTEESLGANSSPLEHVLGNGELLDDVMRHGLHDRYWCYIFERLVKAYSSIKSNNLSNEVTFVQFYLRSVFTRVFKAIQVDKDGLLPSERLLRALHDSLLPPSGFPPLIKDSHTCLPWHENGIFIVSSFGKAKSLWSSFLKYGQYAPCIVNLASKGIAISKKKGSYREPTPDEARYLRHYWSITDEIFEVGEVRTYQKTFYKGELYSVGDTVVVQVDNSAVVENRGHWKAQITCFFSMQHNGRYMLFFCGEYYKQCIVGNEDSERLLIDTITGMSILEKVPLPFNWDCIRPISSLLHKFFPLTLPRSQKVIAYEVKDIKQRDSLLKEGSYGNVPLWLEHHDLVRICTSTGDTQSFEYAVVREIHPDKQEAKFAILKQDARQLNTWKVRVEESTWRSWDNCSFLIKGWVVLKRKKVTQSGQIVRWIPILWRSS